MNSALVTALPLAALPSGETVMATVGAHLEILPIVVLVAIAVAALVRSALPTFSRRRPQLRVIAGSAAAVSRHAA